MSSNHKLGWLQFRMQSVLLLLLAVAVALAWWRDRRQLQFELRQSESLLSALRQDRKQQEFLQARLKGSGSGTMGFGPRWTPQPGPNQCANPEEFVAALRECSDAGIAYEELANAFVLTPIADQSVPAIVELLAEPDSGLRVRAALTLAKMAGAWNANGYKTNERVETLVPALIPLLDHNDFEVRFQACTALQMFGPAATEAIPKLQECLDNDKSSTAPLAGMALRVIDPASDVEPRVIELLQSEDMMTRQMAAHVLEAIGSKQAKASLVSAYAVEVDAALKETLASRIARLDANEAEPMAP